METEKKKDGRSGNKGPKPKGNLIKVPLTIYVVKKEMEDFGGKEDAKEALLIFWNGLNKN